MSTPTNKKAWDPIIFNVAVVGSLLLLNILSIGFFTRLDLTRDKEFTLNKATKTVLQSLKEPLTIKAYFTKDLPPPYVNNRRYVKDLLEEYYAAAKRNFRFEFIDPASAETASDEERKKEVRYDMFGRAVRDETSIERELRDAGIPPVQLRVNQDDKLEIKRAYMGLALQYGDNREVLPVVQQTANLEYDLTSLIHKLTRERPPQLAMIVGNGEADAKGDLRQLYGILGQMYNLTTIDLETTKEIPESLDAALVVRPQSKFSQEALQALDKYLVSGHALALLVDNALVDLNNFSVKEADHGLTNFLASYGISLQPGLLLDAESAIIQVQEQRGFMNIRQPVQYPFFLEPRSLNTDHPLTRGVYGANFPFMAPLQVTPPADLHYDVLVRTSAKSWVAKPPYDINPLQQWYAHPDNSAQNTPVMVTLSGQFKSAYGFNPPAAEAAPTSRLLVASGSSFILDRYQSPANQMLMLNLMDWLTLDDALLTMRSRGLSQAHMADIGESTRKIVKYLNVVLLPLMLIGFGVVRHVLRENRRKHVLV